MAPYSKLELQRALLGELFYVFFGHVNVDDFRRFANHVLRVVFIIEVQPRGEDLLVFDFVDSEAPREELVLGFVAGGSLDEITNF